MVEVLVSTIGASAVTVTLSSIVPTGMTRSTVTTAAGETSTFSCTTVLKASRDAVMRYLPGGRFRNTYVPLADVVTVRVPSSDGLETSIVAPGKGAPSVLVTVPVALPSRTDWAWTDSTPAPTSRKEMHNDEHEALANRMTVLLR